jgi:hypothetical protein
MKTRYALSVIVSAALLLCSGASSKPKITRDSPEYQQAVQTFGSASNLFFINIPSRGVVDDSLVSGMSAAGPSKLSRQIGEIVGKAQTREVDLAVTGDSALKTRTSLITGLEIHKGKQYPRLRVLYFGKPADRQAVEKAVKSVGAGFFFIER